MYCGVAAPAPTCRYDPPGGDRGQVVVVLSFFDIKLNNFL